VSEVSPPSETFDSVTTPAFERPPFWRRIFAVIIDGIVLGVGCSIVALFASDWLSALGPWGRLFGGAIGVVYFGIAASSLCGGQTVGKRILRIVVLRPDGTNLSIHAAFGRAAILMLPTACNGLAVAMTSWIVPTIASIVVFGLGGSILYLFLCNRTTRQATHDLAAGSIVTRLQNGQPVPIRGTVSRLHFIILAVLLVIAAAAAGFGALTLRRKFDFDALTRTQTDVASLTQTSNVQVFYGSTSQLPGSSNTWIRTSVMTYSPRPNPERLASSIAAVVLRDVPTAKSRSAIVITLTTGYDVLFASGWRTESWSRTPEEWQGRIGNEKSLRRPNSR